MKHCKWCDSEFNTEVSYQIYCSVQCREQATKEKIAERYLVLRRQKRIGKERKCKSCQKSLSIYNDEPLCVECFVNPVIVLKTLKKIKGMGNSEE
jgi:hypothetical protein